MHRTVLVGVVIAAGFGLVTQPSAWAVTAPAQIPDWTLTITSQIFARRPRRATRAARS